MKTKVSHRQRLSQSSIRVWSIQLCLFILSVSLTESLPVWAQTDTPDRTYTTCDDFVRGDTVLTVNGVKILPDYIPGRLEIVDQQPIDPLCDPDGDQILDPGELPGPTDALLQLPIANAACQFLWVPNTTDGTLSKIDTRTGVEVARFRTGPEGTDAQTGKSLSNEYAPSRTTVDLDCNLWLGNRGNANTDFAFIEGSILKVAFDKDICVDRNDNGVIDTSTGPTDVKDWPTGALIGNDECILVYKEVGFPSVDGIPSSFPRALSIDASNNVWMGLWGDRAMLKFDTNGNQIDQIDVKPYRPYGAVVDAEGFLWVASHFSPNPNEYVEALLKIDPNTKGVQACTFPSDPTGKSARVYGIALDQFGNIWVTESAQLEGSTRIFRVKRSDCNNGPADADVFTIPGVNARGVAVDAVRGDVWAIMKDTDEVVRLDKNGNVIAGIKVGKSPRGIAFDFFGRPWVPNFGTDNTCGGSGPNPLPSSDPAYDCTVSRINPDTNQVDLTVPVGRNPYTYSDMIGYVVLNFTVNRATWTVIRDGTIVQDGQTDATRWRRVTWVSTEPDGTKVRVFVRTSETLEGLEDDANEFMEVQNNQPFFKSGRFIQVKVELSSQRIGQTPRLKEISLFKNNPPVTPPLPPPFQEAQCNTFTLETDVTDPDGDPVTLKWELIQAPDGIRVPQTLSTNRRVTLVLTKPGLYRIRLTASDGQGGESVVETSINVFPSLGCGFTPGKTDFDIGLNLLVHQIYEIIVDVTTARKWISQRRPLSVTEDAVDRALHVLDGIPGEFAELFGLLDNLEETITDFLGTVLAQLENPDLTPVQAALIAKVKVKLEVIETTLLEMRNELESLRDTLDTGDPDAKDVRSALEAAHEAIDAEDLDAARVALSNAYTRLRTARREQGRILAKQRVIMKRFVEVSAILPRIFGALNSAISVTPATSAAQAIRLEIESPVSLWVVPQQDGSFVFRAEHADVKSLQVEVFKLNGERVAQRRAPGNLVTFQPVDAQGRSLANGLYLVVISVRGENQTRLIQHIHKLTILQK